MNLAMADLIYCLISLPSYAINYLYGGWFWGKTSCQITAILRYVNAYAEWLSVAMIAVIRCFVLINQKLAFKLLSGIKGYGILALIWIYANVLVFPMYVENLDFGAFGYHCGLRQVSFENKQLI